MTRRVAAGLLLMSVAVLVPQVAAAKGTSSAKVTGPGLAKAIRLPADDVDANELARAAGLFAGLLNSDSDDVDAERPPGDLGPRYIAKYAWLIGTDKTVPVRQFLYPFATSGPVNFTPAGQRIHDLTSTGRWYRAGDDLVELLVTLGIPPNQGSVVAAQRSWTTRAGSHGVSVAYPPGWDAAGRPLTTPGDPADALAVGTYALRSTPNSSCPMRAFEDLGLTDVLITAYVYAVPQTRDLPVRPDRFGPNLDWGSAICGDRAENGTLLALSFQEAGRHIFVQLLLGEEVSAAREAEAYRILDMLVVESRG
ncbi:MAG: hypothetical protein WD598_18105 [Acidimicrobiia bacterium]